jgi:chromate transporter
MSILTDFAQIGFQSFGGGSATLAMIQRLAVEKRRWLSEEEFARDWALVQMAPGINLVAITILIGRRVTGIRGSVAALLGLLAPSVTLTIVMTAFFAWARETPLVQAALKGIIPATVGMGLWTSVTITRPLLRAARRDGRLGLALGICALLISALGVALFQAPVLAVLFIGGLLCMLAAWRGAGRVSRA